MVKSSMAPRYWGERFWRTSVPVVTPSSELVSFDLAWVRRRSSRLTPLQWTVYGLASLLGHGALVVALGWLAQGTWGTGAQRAETPAIDIIEVPLSRAELFAQLPEAAIAPPAPNTNVSESAAQGTTPAQTDSDLAESDLAESDSPESGPLEPNWTESQTEPEQISLPEAETQASEVSDASAFRGFRNPFRGLQSSHSEAAEPTPASNQDPDSNVEPEDAGLGEGPGPESGDTQAPLDDDSEPADSPDSTDLSDPTDSSETTASSPSQTPGQIQQHGQGKTVSLNSGASSPESSDPESSANTNGQNTNSQNTNGQNNNGQNNGPINPENAEDPKVDDSPNAQEDINNENFEGEDFGNGDGPPSAPQTVAQGIVNIQLLMGETQAYIQRQGDIPDQTAQYLGLASGGFVSSCDFSAAELEPDLGVSLQLIVLVERSGQVSERDSFVRRDNDNILLHRGTSPQYQEALICAVAATAQFQPAQQAGGSVVSQVIIEASLR